MPQLISSHTTATKTKILFLIFSVLLLGALTVGARAWLMPVEIAGPLPEGRLETELLTIRPTGFDPVEITRPAGRFVIAVNNLSGVDELDLHLEGEAGARQHEVRMSRGRLASKKLVNLPPGKYLLKEANHADWVCSITITPN